MSLRKEQHGQHTQTSMASTLRRSAAILAVALIAALAGALPAGAHNAGHVFLPDGTCHEVGSFLPAPLVGSEKVALDLIPATPQDEYGASFAAFQGDTPLLPGGCPR
jgi:hypothetical protein